MNAEEMQIILKDAEGRAQHWMDRAIEAEAKLNKILWGAEGKTHFAVSLVDDPLVDQVEMRYRYKEDAAPVGIHYGDMLRSAKAFLAAQSNPANIEAARVAGVEIGE